MAIHLTQTNRDLAFEGEFNRVREKVEHDLLPHVAIDVDKLLQRRAVDDQAQPRAFASGAEITGEVACETGQISRFIRGLRTAGLDTREIKQCVNKPKQ